ncbi:hypothetical protein [Methylobacter luteus]|uniref:hypothetical protein n=1 Tax=Methylobacter luteus TaxID=415 RepID=UPI000480D73A|nr:hypothetical protein [Methylobacter luteus]
MVNFSGWAAPKTIDFISLHELMEELASYTELQYSNSEEARFSEAADNLYQALSNSAKPPKWAKINKEPFKLENALKPKKGPLKPIFCDDVSIEGMEMLRHMAGWHERKIYADNLYIKEQKSAREQGIDESLVLRSHNPNDGAYKGADFIRSMEIGFDRHEIAAFLGCQTDPAICRDRERTEHVKEWVKRTDYKGGKVDKVIIAELQEDKPDLWGKNDAVFRKWIQLPEAKPLLPNTRRR